MKTQNGAHTAGRTFTHGILVFQGIGFGLIVALLWLDECLDLPHHLFGVPRTPVNWSESLIESVLVFILGAGTLFWTDRVLARIRYLEGFVVICSFCRKVRSEDEWVRIEEYITDHSEVQFTSGFCPECRERYFLQSVDPGQVGDLRTEPSVARTPAEGPHPAKGS